MTQLEKLQKQIDKCNRKDGCNSKCSKEIQEKCPLLLAHTARRNECREKNIPIELW